MIPIPLLAKLISPTIVSAVKTFLGNNIKQIAIAVIIIIGCVSAVLFYNHWENTIYQNGVDDTVKAYEIRDKEADDEVNRILKETETKNAIKEEKDNEHFKNVATVYSNEIKELNDRVNDLSSKRMSIRTKAPENCRAGTGEKANDEQGSVGTGGGIFEVEIERETGKNLRQIIEEIRKGEIACGLVTENVKREFDLK